MKNPRAQNGAPMTHSMCTCGHVYIRHTSPELVHQQRPERPCRLCPCPKFEFATDAQYAELAKQRTEEQADADELVRQQMMLGGPWTD